MSNEPAGGAAPGPDSTATTKIPLPPTGDREPAVAADDFQPDLAAHDFQPDVPDHEDPAEFADTEGFPVEEPNGTAASMPASDKQSSMPASGSVLDARLRQAARRLRRRSHPRIAALRRAAGAAHRGGHIR